MDPLSFIFDLILPLFEMLSLLSGNLVNSLITSCSSPIASFLLVAGRKKLPIAFRAICSSPTEAENTMAERALFLHSHSIMQKIRRLICKIGSVHTRSDKDDKIQAVKGQLNRLKEKIFFGRACICWPSVPKIRIFQKKNQKVKKKIGIP